MGENESREKKKEGGMLMAASREDRLVAFISAQAKLMPDRPEVTPIRELIS